MAIQFTSSRISDVADLSIRECISLTSPKSFFLFAGAGSGKTGSLIEALRYAREHLGPTLSRENRYIGIITYTNAAADEILRRNEQYPFFVVSTIHSFAWNLIEPFQRDIKSYLINKLQGDLVGLAKKNGKNKDRDITKKENRLEIVRNVLRFSYSPTKPNTGRDSLSHGDVINICSDFLQKPLMQEVLVSRFPVLLIDESQDTNKNLMDSFLNIQHSYSSRFMLGLFGDMMQRIYLDGKDKLDKVIGDSWAKPEKVINYRSPKRIVDLINTIRRADDGRDQQPFLSAVDGFVRIFIAASSHATKVEFEGTVCQMMAAITGDSLWSGEGKDVKTLTLEHKMAAERFGFMTLFEALDQFKPLKEKAFQRLTDLDPSPQLKELAFFTDILIPLRNCHRDQDKFGIATVVKESSPLLQMNAFASSASDHSDQMLRVKEASYSLLSLWDGGKDPLVYDIIDAINKTMLFDIPENLINNIINNQGDGEVLQTFPNQKNDNDLRNKDVDPDESLKRSVWRALGPVPFSQIEKYYSYIRGESFFDTHQGVKGLQFPRIMVVLDDEAAGGNLFSYEKLFGVKSLSDTDKRNIKEGKDSTLSRTNRLFYVVCSRAEQSLAIVVYTAEPQMLKELLVKNNIFNNEEICM